MEVTFTINGTSYSVSPLTVPIETTLNTFIRNNAQLTGTKFMCLEGGCGVCVVTLKGVHPGTKHKLTWSVNSKIYSCHGLEIITVEGIGSKKKGMHQIQQRLAHFNGTQCGYCSSGMVMNMYALLDSKNGKISMEEVENSFGGNICRCTGYRPILDAFKSLASDADERLVELCKDIEDLDKICPKTGSACAGKCTIQPKKAIHFSSGEAGDWFKVYNVGEIFDIFGKIADKPYMLVAGNTAHGVYRRPHNIEVFIDTTSIEEMRSYNLTSKGLELGGNITLTDAMEIFTKTAMENKNFEYLNEMAKHFDLIANVPVRNNGTIAGNLMIKNSHHEFPSDVYITCEAASAIVTVSDGKRTFNMLPKDFVNFDMKKKVFLKITLPPYDSSIFLYRSFKIMPRAQNAHAFVNSAFQLQLNSETVIEDAKLCFGGIDDHFTHAEKTESFLKGKNPYINETVQGALEVLKTELKPDWVMPDASPEYRKNLALALFYKFMLNIVPETKSNQKFKSGGNILKRDLSSGTQVFDTYEKNWPLTKNIPKIEAEVQCTGEAKYVNDIPMLPNQVYGAFVSAKRVHGKISSIDATKALNIPGVVAFFSAKDVPGLNNFASLKALLVVEMEEIFCSSEVKYNGQPVGIILAETNELANRAVEFVEVKYVAKVVDEVVATLSDALEKESGRLFPMITSDQQPQEIGEDEDIGRPTKKISGRFDVGLQYHFTMETQTCVVLPIADGIDVYSSTQYIDATQMAVADALKIPVTNVNMQVRRLGGAYGSKISRGSQIACATAIAAHLLNRPVRFVMTIESNMTVVGKRYACIGDYEVDVEDNGKIRMLKNDYVEDSGCAMNEPVTAFTTKFINNCYDSRSFKITAKTARTDAPSSTWCRAPGSTEGLAMIENIMEHIARKVERDPFEVRLTNLASGSEMRRILPDFAQSVEYYNRKKEINNFNDANRWIKRGIAIVPMKYGIEYLGTTHATVSIYHGDGSVAVTVGSIEMGQGLNTKVAVTVSYILGVPLEKISIKPSNSVTSPNAFVTGASIGSEIAVYAAKKACEEMLSRLRFVRSRNPNADWPQLIDKAYEANVNLLSTYMYKADELKPYNIWAASCCEVEVDVLTGNLLVKRVDILEDVGESLSPGIDIGQIEGAFVMGLGYWLTERLIFNRENGELMTTRTWNYKPPGAKDIPIDFRVTFLRNSSNPAGVLRSKATGEPALVLSVSVICAIRHALDSARKDSGLKVTDEYYHLGAPTTVETIFLAANNQLNHFLLK